MVADGQVVFEITADGKHAIASVQDVTRAIQQESKKWESATGDATQSMENSFTSMLTKIGSAFAAAKIGQKLLEFGSQAIDAASDLREVQNVVDVTFGEGATKIETWAKTAQSQFGLTETQAKKFTSTLGAMMKSSGLAGDEIVGMTTDLAGLTADMASFYNLDFDTAFQKIRAGISGETEPLKQLGINMSVANLEAYALTKGITKSFDEMSQGEQIMLRYQYLMQATADAQGDFARTADGYANSQRRIETAIESIKTAAGNMLMEVVEPLTSKFADFLTKLTTSPEKTVLDEFADIDASTEAKMAEITATAENARALVGVLQEIQTQKVQNANLESFVTGLSTKLGDLDQAMTAAKNGDYQGTISGIANAMALKTGSDATAWNTLLTAISQKLPSAAEAVDADGNTYKDFLTTAAQAAAELGGDYPALWQTFLDTLGSDAASAALTFMAQGQTVADALDSIGISAGGLDGSEKDNWSGLLGVLATAEPTKGMFGNDAATAASNISTLATALTSNDPSTRQEAWASMLGTLTDNIDGVAALAKQSPEDTKKWLEGLATEAAKIDPNDPEAWGNLFNELWAGLPGLADTDVGAAFLNNLGLLATNSNSLKADSAKSWSDLLSALNSADTTSGIFGQDAAAKINNLASALSGTDPAKKKEAWSEMLGVLSANADGVAKLTNKSSEEVKKWLEALAAGADEIDPNDPTAWQGLMDALVGGLSGLKDVNISNTFLNSLKKFAQDGNLLKSDSASNWSSLLNTLNTANVTQGIFGTDAASKITSLATALSGTDPAAKKDAWSEVLGILSSNADAVSKLTDKSPEELKAWFEQLSEAAPETGENLEAWNLLLTGLAGSFTELDKEGLGNEFVKSLESLDANTEGSEFFAQLAAGFLQLEKGTDQAGEALRALGIDTEGVEDTQALWLETCKDLVKTIPGLSDIIDTNTGAIKGGIDEVKKYVDEWEAANLKMIAMQALQAKQQALADKKVGMTDYWIEAQKAAKKAEAQAKKVKDIQTRVAKEGLWTTEWDGTNFVLYNKELDEATKTLNELEEAAKTANDEYERQSEAVKEAEDDLKIYQQVVEEMPGDIDKYTDSTEAATAATEQFTATEKEAENALKSAQKALDEVEKYYDNAYKSIEKNLEGAHELFGTVTTPAQEAKKKTEELEASLKNLKKTDKKYSSIQEQLTGLAEGVKSIDRMNAGLQSQITYYKEYQKLLERAKELGYSDEVLAAIADGSAESYDTLVAMTESSIQEGDHRIEELNTAFASAASEREKLTKELTETSLETDKAFKQLTDSALAAIEGLNLGQEAQTAMENTVQGIADGIAAKIPKVQEQVNALNASLSKLSGLGLNFSPTAFTFGGKTNVIQGEYATGLDYVPFDHYLASLHEGEGILTAEENKIWQAFKTSGMNSRNVVDYDALGATMRDNIHAGGNVYLDGRTVGQVISATQANSYRAMERSGFQQ